MELCLSATVTDWRIHPIYYLEQQWNNIPISVTVILHAHITDIKFYAMLQVWFTLMKYE